MAAATDSARDRLLAAAAELLDAAQGGEVSTRAITERAGVQAPTLYHHFGNKQALLDAVIAHGFTEFLVARLAEGDPGGGAADPIDDVRAGWDLHVRYGLEHPGLYVLIPGRTIPGEPPAVVTEVEAMILRALQPAALQGRLRVPPALAARQLLAASTGVVLTLIAQRPQDRDLALSGQVRDAVLAGLTVPDPPEPASGAASVPDDGTPEGGATVRAAIALQAALEQEPADALSEGEATLLAEWLSRLSGGRG